MTWTQLSQQVSSIPPADRGAMEAARRRWDAIAKPLRGLGRLEDLLVRMAGVTGSPDLDMDRKAVAVFCADNGVVAEGVTQTGQEVTWTVAQTMGERRSSVCHMARTAGAQVFPVDLGMVRRDTPPGVRPCVVLEGGTRNMAKGPAMPREAAERALAVGFSLARELAEDGDTLLAAGEMGIGNTTTTAAVACALLGLSPREAVGRGAGLSDAGLARKRHAVERALEVNRPDPGDPVDILCKVGGLDIAAMTGFYLGCAAAQVPVILDGAISAAAALLAVRLCPNAEKALLPSHWPSEPCGQVLLSALGLEPVLHGNFHLGEAPGRWPSCPCWIWPSPSIGICPPSGEWASGPTGPTGSGSPPKWGRRIPRDRPRLWRGGQRKERVREKLACKLPRSGALIYLATMEPFGPEAEARIRRPPGTAGGQGIFHPGAGQGAGGLPRSSRRDRPAGGPGQSGRQ